MASLEHVVTARLRRFQDGFLLGLSVTCLVVFLGLAAAELPLVSLATAVRAWLGWFGLALLSARMFGWRLAWTGPAVAVVAALYWGYAGSGRYEWWDFSAHRFDDPSSLALCLVLLGVGCTSYWLTPWRRLRFPR
ncbi:hypothetical protein ACTMS2_12775 [Micromonospora sp. SD12]|uniref:hypothetical protein n=1 Tax=Micromonospora sp. SD12 TaxID=3452216 RepID=UPI003F8CE024